jgi:hypothetical protein
MKRFVFAISIAAIAALFTLPALAGAANSPAWKVYNYNPSGQALAPSPAVSSAADNASFNFQQNVYTAQLLTSAKALTGDLTGGTVNAMLTVTGVTGTFVDQNGGGCTPDNQTVRLFFSTPGFAYTNYWWSNPMHMTLTGDGTMTLNVPLTDPSLWSDWNGQNGASSESVTAGFNAAVAKVNQIGLSFGGGCFFENGVTTSDGSGTFALTGFSVSH